MMSNLASKPIFLHGVLAAIGFAAANFRNYLTELAHVPDAAITKDQSEQSSGKYSFEKKAPKHGAVIAVMERVS
jgi:hypothetical protein